MTGNQPYTKCPYILSSDNRLMSANMLKGTKWITWKRTPHRKLLWLCFEKEKEKWSNKETYQGWRRLNVTPCLFHQIWQALAKRSTVPTNFLLLQQSHEKVFEVGDSLNVDKLSKFFMQSVVNKSSYNNQHNMEISMLAYRTKWWRFFSNFYSLSIH